MHIRVDHQLDELLELRRWLPTEQTRRFTRIATQELDLSRAVIPRIDFDEDAAALSIAAALGFPRPLPAQLHASARERHFRKLAHAVRFAGGDHEVLRLAIL